MNFNNFFKLTKNKGLEIQLVTFEKEWSWFDFQVRLNRCCDHAGFMFNIEIVGISFWFCIYDFRHWDYATNDWS